MTYLLAARFALLAALLGLAVGLVYLERAGGGRQTRPTARRARD